MTNMQNLSANLMNDHDVLAAVELIRSVPGRNEKEAHLASLSFSEKGRRMIHWCYNPFVTFGVTMKKEPAYNASVTNVDQFAEVEALLSDLASRKLTGNAAKDALTAAFETLNPSAAHLLWLALNKDFKAGVGEVSIKGVNPSLIPIFAVMRAEAYQEKHVKKFPVVVEPKLDGNRVSFIARDGSGGFFTRTGKVIAALDHMVPTVLSALKHWFGIAMITAANDAVNEFRSKLTATNGIPNVMLDGEMMSDKGFDEVNGALNRKEDVHGLSFNLFDMLSWEEFDAMGAVEVSYTRRRLRLNHFVFAANAFGLESIKQTPVKVCHTHDAIMEAYAQHRAEGQEGSMVKDPEGFYEKRKSRSWLKLKNEDTEDLPVVGAYQGQADGKYADTIGGLIVDRNGVQVRVSGISDADRAVMWELWVETCEALGADPAVGYKGASFAAPDSAGSFLGRLIEVEFHEATKDGSLRHPRFVRWRDDKTGEVEK